MGQPFFHVTVETDDQTGEVLAVYLQVKKGAIAKTLETKEGVCFADYDRKGRLLGVELLAPCNVTVLNKLTTDQSERRFFKRSAPRGMLVAAG